MFLMLIFGFPKVLQCFWLQVLYFLWFWLLFDAKCCMFLSFVYLLESNIVFPEVLKPIETNKTNQNHWKIEGWHQKPVVVSHTIFIQNWPKSSSGCLASSCGCFFFNSYSNLIPNLSWLPCLLPWLFLIPFLFQTDPNPFCLGSSCGKTDPKPLLAAMSPPVVVKEWWKIIFWLLLRSYSILIKNWY